MKREQHQQGFFDTFLEYSPKFFTHKPYHWTEFLCDLLLKAFSGNKYWEDFINIIQWRVRTQGIFSLFIMGLIENLLFTWCYCRESSEIALLGKFIISMFGNFQKLFLIYAPPPLALTIMLVVLFETKMIQPWW